jgi:hypothetical protein
MAGTTDTGASTGYGGDGGVKEQAQEKAQEVRDQAGEQMRRASGQARDRVREEVDQRSTDAGRRVTTQADDLRSISGQLREQGKDAPARLVDQVADRTERAGTWLTESDGDRILRDVEDFGRRNPWGVVAAGVALGFAASRMLKASSSRRYEEQASTRGLPRPGATTTAAPRVQPTAVATPGVTTPAPGGATEERFTSPGGGL